MTIHWPLFLSIFSFIFLAELPDKTAFATLLLATRSKPMAVFLGVALAFIVQTLVAVTLGSALGLLPEKWVHLCAGLLFFAFAWHMVCHRDEEATDEVGIAGAVDSTQGKEKQLSPQQIFCRSFAQAFMVIFIAEWGDITQLATATFAAKYHHDLLTVFLASLLALWSVTLLAIILGHHLKRVLHINLLKKISAVVFIMVGCYFIYTTFQSSIP